MANILDYITWRSDIHFKISPFNHVDSLILCQLVYLELENIVSDNFSKTIKISEVANRFIKDSKKDLGLLVGKDTVELLKKVGTSTRFKDVTLFGFTNIIDVEKETQFSAMCALLPTKQICIIFRGTDDSLVGWKEDFNMSYVCPVPAQELAVKYVEKVALKKRNKLLVMGHSKGGNLSVFSSSFCSNKVQNRIVHVYDNDGPGFLPHILSEKGYIKVLPKVTSVVPESSLVGILLNKNNKQVIITSSAAPGIAQHDMLTWQVEATSLITFNKFGTLSLITSQSVQKWLQDSELEIRRQFIIDLFSVLESTNAKTLSELTNDWIKSSVTVIKAMSELDKKTKDHIYEIIKILFHAIQVNIPTFKDFFK